MSNFTARPYQIYRLPLDTTMVLHPEQAVLQIDERKTVDFGLLCFSSRSSERRSRLTIARKVDMLSLDSRRVTEIRTVIDTISCAIDTGSRATWHKKCVNFVKFAELCDRNDHRVSFSEEASCRSALNWFVKEMWRLVSQHEMALSSASLYQDHVISMLNLIFQSDDLAKGLNLLRRNYDITESASVPDDAAQSKSLAWYFSLFDGICDLVLNVRIYPYHLKVPGYIEWPEDCLWLFPVQQWFVTPTENGANHTDHKNGRIKSFEEAKDLYSSPTVARKNLRLARDAIDKANNDPYHPSRLERGMLAMQSFVMIFYAATGINPSQAADIRWDEVLQESIDNPQVERQNFRVIKYRAGGIIVSFEIGAEFMPRLRKYVELRRYLLRGTDSEWFFFSLGLHLEKVAERIVQGSAVATLQRIISRIDPSIEKIPPREWRAAKLDFVTRRFGPIASAEAGQHSLTTALKNYNNGSLVQHQVEMAAFWEEVERKIILGKTEQIAGSEDTALGLCASPGNPSAAFGSVPLIPDCKGPEGCLFCDKYRVHADDTDTRKLLSAQFCLRAISHRSGNQGEFDAVFGRALLRIDEVLQYIRDRDNDMVEQIASEVAEGNLHRFWAAKMEIFIELDLL